MHIKKERSSSPEIVQHVVARRSAPRRAYVGVSKVRPSYAEIAGTSRRRVSPTAVQGPMSDADESSVDVVDSPGRAVNAAFLKSISEPESVQVAARRETESMVPASTKTVIPTRGARVPGAGSGTGMKTRASNGIMKKRVLEDAATFSDIEQEYALSPSKKRKDSPDLAKNPIKKSFKNTNLQKSSRVSKAIAVKPQDIIPDPPSDFLSSDGTPPKSVFAEPRKQKVFKKLFADSDDDRSISSPSPKKSAEPSPEKSPGLVEDDDIFSISPLKLDSAKKGKQAIKALLPAGEISSSVPSDFEKWQQEQNTFYAKLKQSNKSKRSEPARFNLPESQDPSDRKPLSFEKDTRLERETPPIDWPPSPLPRQNTTSYRDNHSRKGKGQVVESESELLDSDVSDDTREALQRVLAIERSQKHSTLSSINKAASKSQPPKDPSKPSGKSSNMLPTVSSPRSTAGGSFAAALAKKGVDVSKILEKSLVSVQGPTDERYFADLHGYRVVTLPDQCEVDCADFHDVLLEDDYTDLPKLKAGIFRSWSSAIGSGYVWFSGWAFQTPGLNIEQVIAILLCLSANHNHYINLSRISPLDLHTVHTALDGTRSVLHANRCIAVCLSPMLVVESQLSSPTDRGLRNKFIKGTLHHQEMQRFVGVTCMVFNQPVLHAQIERDSMIFSTMGSWHASDSKPPSSSARNYLRTPGIIGKTSKDAKTKGYSRATKVVLDVSDTVPVYDAHKRPFDYAKDLDDIDRVLPLFNGEVPPGSLAVAAYTLSVYKKGDNWNLSSNIQFVIVVATE